MTSATEISLLRIAAQRLAGPRHATPADAVRWSLCVQGQELPGALSAVALRTTDGSRAGVRAAMDAGDVVRSWPMRGTLHLVAGDDLPWLLELLTARALSGVEKRREVVQLTVADLERSRELAVGLLSGRRRLSRPDLLAALGEAGALVDGPRGYHTLWFLSQTGTLVLGPTDGTEQQFVLLEEWLPGARRPEREEALGELAWRYLAGHGPATVPDLVRWAGLTVRDARAGLALVRDRLESTTVDGTEHWLDPATPELLAAHRADAQRVLLLPGFDELVLGYADRSCTVPAEHAARIVPGNNGVFRPTVVVGGVAVATWRVTGARRAVTVEAFGTLDPAVEATVPDLAAGPAWA
ncbi:winged helix DNA-binding domain-containing protein [Modestobacter sp. I12A-02628]|uniref:Winged helix DNA-binding domain-containing protein n=1 Tax=Goekera deserti TaxID=2497753 RepID=A0A7K3WC48_9ACTN|nr:winged helix DNA-binding domain-containing protein [Goekera deserti]MPQ98341.1 winged helix DNA-binding domain-containing protein [Goekera deserti]NDI48168.1 winged helix DNA-binding domain-containing protein [Goekera deserti]NEL53917.1 winged helix DNA-binding domain-containing protein [Goekera deserti]